ncbi:cob(I)yrinic acid a,c-diamide adenosyltransferase [Niabella insulamsoli]|uniref:cob(I)yrinic acid a,c-diamide adenosyltransferase n=1 Tax=Niabella insulamsoli TaxID=3144874 RepID=UPI0031FCD4ED
MAFKIYTKTGDNGHTSLIGGVKISKADLRIECYGTIDELNAHIGLCKDLLEDTGSKESLQQIQDCLFTIGALLARDPDKNVKMELPDLREADCIFLEKEIDRMETVLSPLKYFILPGGAVPVSQLHIARCVCRRAERCGVRLNETAPVDPLVLKYLNRLNDYLFVLARYTGRLLEVDDIPWKPGTAQ